MQPAPIERLVAAFSRLPGVGPRTAQRLTYHVLSRPDEDARALATALIEVKELIGECRICFNLAEGERCVVCEDPRRDPALLCVVETPADVLPIERTHEYRGRYHVLGGALSPVDGVGPRDLRLQELYRRVLEGDPDAPVTGDGPLVDDGTRPAGGPTVTEVVVATNPTTSGEATALHIGAELRERSPQVTVTRLASGLPVGADLEHADEVTLGRAFAGRRAI
ncbi:recombination mediator RecR [Patulibacter sp.]|uniref:recombination mediator RecR n=1 Tax=Patulibacter sp. TaxID=1912859 RepID=UPI002721021B|nr:recombination mediator RecR [Patulibacter sp.]MDO9409171.1 recombination mediator RecR [Patulibacter sp.]